MTTQDCADAVTGDLAAEPKRPQRPAQRTDIFLEDLSAGQIFGSATYQIGVAEIKRFAGESVSSGWQKPQPSAPESPL